MGNPKPTPLRKRGRREKLNPDEETITRSISLPESTWKKLDEIAAKYTEREHAVITAQAIIRKALSYSMSTVVARLAEGTILREFSKCFGKYGLEIRAIPKYRKK